MGASGTSAGQNAKRTCIDQRHGSHRPEPAHPIPSLTEHLSGLDLGGQQRFADAVDVLGHDPDDVLTTLNQFWHLNQQRRVIRLYKAVSTFVRSHEGKGPDPAGGPGAGRGDGHPQVSIGVSLLDDVVGDGASTIVQGRFPGNEHVVSVDLLKDDGALGRLRPVWRGGKRSEIKNMRQLSNFAGRVQAD